MYLVRICKQAVTVEILGLQRELGLSWSDGMVGAAPVFENYDDALRYSNDRPELIIEAKVEK
jgi:hypothetical protein